jgi:hypothetical protein
VVLIPVIGLIVLFCPPGINIFLSKFFRAFFPLLRGCPFFFDPGIFFFAISLARGFYEGCINDFPFI